MLRNGIFQEVGCEFGIEIYHKYGYNFCMNSISTGAVKSLATV
jgi:hypothetical protein